MIVQLNQKYRLPITTVIARSEATWQSPAGWLLSGTIKQESATP